MMTDTLTPQGAQLLRQTRDHILANPEEFDRGVWDCGTQACIAGHLVRLGAKGRRIKGYTPEQAVQLLGFTENQDLGLHATAQLFSNDMFIADNFDVQKAADDINAFLWQYGYPPTEMIEEPETKTDETHEENSLARGPRQPESAENRTASEHEVPCATE